MFIFLQVYACFTSAKLVVTSKNFTSKNYLHKNRVPKDKSVIVLAINVAAVKPPILKQQETGLARALHNGNCQSVFTCVV